ncbi:hypothetical protein VNO80_21380 [Phaseolus coccineus]|uniref:Uncharacterized protein n=1 Tax=Phaseolus coccineus TaxID=3886 RepID=A0AAN9M307_PHACN
MYLLVQSITFFEILIDYCGFLNVIYNLHLTTFVCHVFISCSFREELSLDDILNIILLFLMKGSGYI